MRIYYINGEFKNNASLPLSDLIILRGVGVFETIATFEGKGVLTSRHLARLLNSAAATRIKINFDISEIKKIIRDGLKLANFNAQVKVYLTGGDVYSEREGFIKPRLFLIFEDAEAPDEIYYKTGVKLEVLNSGRDKPEVKSVDYRAAYVKDAFEVLYCPNGEITEAGHSNFFAIINGELVTAPVGRVLAGTTRAVVIELAKSAGIKVVERCAKLDELADASEAFITGSVKRVLPVNQVGELIIGDGKVGAVTQKLMGLFADWLRDMSEE